MDKTDYDAARKLAVDAKARAEAATPGLWKVATGDEAPDTVYRVVGLLGPEVAFICSTYGVLPTDRNDAAFIAAAREDVPALADAVLALLGELETAKVDADRFAAGLVAAEAENARLRDALEGARTVISRGVELMTPEQLGEWSGVRSWLEQAPEGGEA